MGLLDSLFKVVGVNLPTRQLRKLLERGKVSVTDAAALMHTAQRDTVMVESRRDAVYERRIVERATAIPKMCV